MDQKRKRHLTNFAKANQTTFGDITAAIEAGDITLAHRLVHSLKSGAGFIEKTVLMETARIIENLLRDGKVDIAKIHLTTLEGELNEVLSGLTPLLDESGVHPKPLEPLSKDEAAVLLDKLKLLLEDGDSNCRELIDELRRISGTETLIEQIEAFDFEPASETLEDVKRGLGKLETERGG